MLFRSGDLGQALEAQAKKMVDAVAAESEENLKQADVDEWAAALAHHFAVDCPELHLDQVWREPPKDVKVDVSRDRMRFFSDYVPDLAYEFPGYRVVVHVPFDGDGGVFKLAPSSFTTVWPRGRIGAGELLLTVEWPHDKEPPVDARAQEFLRLVGMYLGWARQQIEGFNALLEREARQAIEARRVRLAERDAALAQSTIPERRLGEGAGKTFIADVLVRRPAPSLPQTRADEKPPQLEPTLEERVFEHVLEVIRKQCLHIEQNPRTYVPMGEEDRRNVILSALQTHYDGFTAETDNQGGHTDILARYQGRNVFICECKFWDGEQSFTATIDQLFGYAGWRDTKLAIVVFVRAKGMTAILEKARATLAAHRQFVAAKEAASETELRAVMRWPGDGERLADLNVFVVPTPQRAS